MSVEVKPDGTEGTPPPTPPPSNPFQPPVMPMQAAVSLKLPPFWPNDPTLWFTQVEAQFVIRHITTQETRFAYVIGSLQPEVAQEVRDILITPPSTDCYDKLKSELIRRTSVSEQKRLHQLLTSEELGDRKPSQLLRRMHQLLGDNKLEERILKQLFVQRLPHTVQSILASTADTVGIGALADLADKIVEVSAHSTPASQISTVSSPPLHPPQRHASPEVLTLHAKVDDLTRQVQALTFQLQGMQRQGRPRSSSRSRPRQRSPTPSADNQPSGDRQCWYHWKYGTNARKCTSPCSRRTEPQRNQENGQAND
ncbi:uncharacterized protein LOC119736438 [Patiria miniata]|uniref:DUF7041 domain-containing protein n=1 Tax=Patiria miniata TaxID=46514 RepID=A0A914ASF1_PATMI|nr:uncharacterized protein LOC119736438 [Patiria miniata]